MYVCTLLQLVSGLIELTNINQQRQLHKRLHSIRGLAFDYVLLSIITYTTSVISTIFYIFDTTIINQYAYRFPIYPQIPISRVILFVEVGLLAMYTLVGLQIFLAYYPTKLKNQFISPINMLILGLMGVTYLYIIRQYFYGWDMVYKLDLVDYLWTIAKICDLVRFIPLISMNWFYETMSGIHPNWITLSLIANILCICARTRVAFELNWWEIPVNFSCWTVLAAQFLFLLILKWQRYQYNMQK